MQNPDESNPPNQQEPEVANPVAPAPKRPGLSVEAVPENPLSDEIIRKYAAKTTRRSVIVLAAGAAVGYSFYRYLDQAPETDAQPALLRKTLEANQKLTQALTGDHILAPTYPLSEATELRFNPGYGCKEKLDPINYRLQLAGVANPKRYGDRYVEDLTAWNYHLSDPASDPGSEASFKVDPREEEHPEARPGQGPVAVNLKANGGTMGKDDLEQPTSAQEEQEEKEQKEQEEKKSAAQAPPSNTGGGQPPAKSAQSKPPMMTAPPASDHPGRRPRGQEEAGKSDSGLDQNTPGLLLTMDDLRKLPHRELVTQFKCIEGWSQIVHWGGIRLADLIAAYPPARNPDGSLPKYVYMETPDGDYYCGFDMIDCLHPQSLLVTEMAGKPLTQFHGAPLRLHMPIKYGYKQIKRIGLISYTNDKPDDYWTKLGYDWYAGL